MFSFLVCSSVSKRGRCPLWGGGNPPNQMSLRHRPPLFGGAAYFAAWQSHAIISSRYHPRSLGISSPFFGEISPSFSNTLSKYEVHVPSAAEGFGEGREGRVGVGS